MNLKIGDVVAMHGCTAQVTHEDYSASFTFRAPKKERLVFLLLGAEGRDGKTPLDLEKRMNQLGWVRKEN